MRCKSRVFLFHNGFKMPGMCLICALLAKKCLAVCLALYLAFDARRCGRGGSGCEICGRCLVPSYKRKSLSGLIVGRAFVLSGGLIAWGCGCCKASSVGGWVSDRGRAGGTGRSPAGAVAGCGAADLCMLSPGGVRWLPASERMPGACCGVARAGRLCGFGILPNKSLQCKGPCMYRAIACKSSICINGCTACKR